MHELTPKEIVSELDKYIISQDDAKRAVAVALRNRFRRSRLGEDIKEEVIPKNILMIGPTGVGKTEIARRLAKLADAPFVKVEATKYTEVGYVGRDVESMVRDLVEGSIRMVRAHKSEQVKETAKELAVERVVELLKPSSRKKEGINPLTMIFGGGQQKPQNDIPPEILQQIEAEREILRKKIKNGELDDKHVEIEVEEGASSVVEIFSATGMEEMGVNFQDMLGGLMPKKKKKRDVKIKDALKILEVEEAQRLIDMEEVKREAIKKCEEHGIIFIDEMDKIAGKEKGYGPDVSREGVQRDILPIVEGSTVNTRYGPVKTDHVLFIAAGAFHASKPSDLIPELQGRFPIRVELKNLTRDDFVKILTEPTNALVKQYKALLEVDNVEISFTEDGLEELAEVSVLVNEQTENIGARRLHTILEKVLDEVSFRAPFDNKVKIDVNKAYVKQQLDQIIKDRDLTRYIL
ncbi:MAG: ATP-dependent protease ATPase subunit HslU [Armatimonadota bacterium]